MISDERIRTAAHATLADFLKKTGRRATSERTAILNKVLSLRGRFTADTLFAALQEDDATMSRATVFNTLSLFTDAGLLHARHIGSGPTHYERAEGRTSRIHLVCAMCGKVNRMKDPELEALIASRRFGKFKPAYADINIYGECASCSRKKSKFSKK